MPRSPWKAEGRRGCPSLPAPLFVVSDTVASKDPPKGRGGVVCAQPCSRNLRRGRGTKPGDINILLNGEILTVSVRARCQRFAQFV